MAAPLRRVESAPRKLRGRLSSTRLSIAEGWFAIGLSANLSNKINGYHCENLLVTLDNAESIADGVWDAVACVASGKDNRILAIGAPINPVGRFARMFENRSGWYRLNLSALDHPNLRGVGRPAPGAATRGTVLRVWCRPVDWARHTRLIRVPREPLLAER